MSALKTKSPFLILVLGAALLAAWLGACAYTEPPPPCPVAAGSPLGTAPGGSPYPRLPDFWAKYTLKSANTTDTCAHMAGEEVAFQKFSKPSDLTNFTLALRSYRMGYIQGNPNDFGSSDLAGDALDKAGNPVADNVYRADPKDPNNLKMSAIGKLTPFPDSSNICTASDFSAADEDFAEVDVPLVPGGDAVTSTPTEDDPIGGTAVIKTDDAGVMTAVFPELHMKYEWNEVKIVSTTFIPGSVFTGTLRYTENNCTATYDVLGYWPLTPCHTDNDCSPVPLPNAGVCLGACSRDGTVGTCDSTHYCDAGIPDVDAGTPGPGPSDPGVCLGIGTVAACALGDVSIGTRLFQGSGLNPTFVGPDAGYPAKCNLAPQIQYQLSTNGIGSNWGVCELTIPVAQLQTASQ